MVGRWSSTGPAQPDLTGVFEESVLPIAASAYRHVSAFVPGLAGDRGGIGARVNETDLPERIGEVRRRLVVDAPPWTRAQDSDFDRVTVAKRDCDLLRDLFINECVETVVEVALAYGSSAWPQTVGEALVLVDAPRPRHIIIDPLLDTEWSSRVAAAGVCRARRDRPADSPPVIDGVAATRRQGVHRRCGIGRREPSVP